MLAARDVRAGAVFHHAGGSPGTAEARNRQTEDQNRAVLGQFRGGQLEVLVNIRMLTEGTDIPEAQTVFLTRQTTSQILLTQMVGRALRGPRFGGTDTAYIVSFIDDWRHRINWAGFGPLQDGAADERESESVRRLSVQLVSVELVGRLARQMDSGANVNPGSYRSILPAGWYDLRYEAVVAGTDDVEPEVRRLAMVFEGEVEGFGRLIERLHRDHAGYEEPALEIDEVRGQVDALEAEFFGGNDARVGDRKVDILAIARHMAQKDGRRPEFFPFAARDHHDLDVIAQRHLDARLDRLGEDDALWAEYHRPDRLWQGLYRTYPRFVHQYQGCSNRLLLLRRQGADGAGDRLSPPRHPEAVPDREPSEEVRLEVFRRDGGQCQCCGFTGRNSQLRADHIRSYYHGGLSARDNLQTLCAGCNTAKGTEFVSFRLTTTPLAQAPQRLPQVGLAARHARDLDEWVRYVRRVVNLFYHCRAVETVDVAARGERFRRWQVKLFSGNDPSWLAPFVQELVGAVRATRAEAGLQPAPDVIEVV